MGLLPSHPDRVRRNYPSDRVSITELRMRIFRALHALEYYSAQSNYGDAVVFAKAALLGLDVDEMLDAEDAAR